MKVPSFVTHAFEARSSQLALAGTAALVVVSLAGGELRGIALRSAAVLGALAMATAWVQCRIGSRSVTPLAVEIRHSLTKDAGLALVRVESRRLLVGYGQNGVSLVIELGEEREAPCSASPGV